MKRVILSCMVIAMVVGVESWFQRATLPVVATDFAVMQVKDSDEAFVEMQTYEEGRNWVEIMFIVSSIGLLALIWREPITKVFRKGRRRMKTKQKYHSGLWIVAITILLAGAGCIRSYPKPVYADVDNNETAFVIPLEGETGKQMQFASVEFLEKAQVATKRITIPLRWNKTGRLRSSGEWLPMVKVLKVDRTPITREWTADVKTGSNQKDQAIWVESGDSVGFSVGFSCTAYIKPEDAAQFLFLYPSGSLARILDTEVRTRIQAVAAKECSKDKMDVLREKKNNISTAVENDVIGFYSNRGITITAIAMFGGFHYENPDIQTAIDKTFMAQQEKVISEALYDAQQKKNDTIELAAEAEASKIRTVNAALDEANKNPLYLQIKLAEIESSRVEKWDGRFPQWYMGDSLSGMNGAILLNPGGIETGK